MTVQTKFHLRTLDHIANKKIIYGVLNWGLGHVVRSIPIIEKLSICNEVILASDGVALEFLRHYFSNHHLVKTVPYKVLYPYSSVWKNMLIQAPKIWSAIQSEHRHLSILTNELDVDLIISDSRFGFWHDSIPSFIISHQIQIHSPNYWLSKIASTINQSFLKKFDSVWILDDQVKNIAGVLSRSRGLKSFNYIGFYTNLKNEEIQKYDYDVCAILSAEPQRSVFEDKLKSIFQRGEYKACIVGGKVGLHPSTEFKLPFDYFPFLYRDDLNRLINKSKIIICRSGYTSIIDLTSLNKKAILIPTPGQTEQEYLADFHNNSKYFIRIRQDQLTSKSLSSSMNQLLK